MENLLSELLGYILSNIGEDQGLKEVYDERKHTNQDNVENGVVNILTGIC